MVQRNAAGRLRVSLNYLSPRELGDKGGESEYEDSAGGFASLNPPYPLLPATRCNISFGGLAIALSVGRVLRVVLPSPLPHEIPIISRGESSLIKGGKSLGSTEEAQEMLYCRGLGGVPPTHSLHQYWGNKGVERCS